MITKSKIQQLNAEYTNFVKAGSFIIYKGAKKYIISKVSEPITEYMGDIPICRYVAIYAGKKQFFLYDTEFNNQFVNNNTI